MFSNLLKINSNFTVKRYESFSQNLKRQLRISKFVPPNSARRSYASFCKHRSYFYRPSKDFHKNSGNLEALKFVPTAITTKRFSDKVEERVPALQEEEKDDFIIFEGGFKEDTLPRDTGESESKESSSPSVKPVTGKENMEDINASILSELQGLSLSEKKRLLNVLDKQVRVEGGGDQTLMEALTEADDTIDQHNIIPLLTAVKTSLRTERSLQPHHKKVLNTLTFKLRNLYPEMSPEELLLVLYCFDKMELGLSNQSVKYVLQILKFHLNKLSIRNIVHLDFTLKKQSEDPLSKSILFALPVVAEANLNDPEKVADATLHDLLIFAGFCIQNKVTDTYKVLEEISRRGIHSPRYAISLVWNLFSLPPKPFFKFMVPPESEITVEILTKECLTIMARNITEYSTVHLLTTLSKANWAFEHGLDFVYHEEFLRQMARLAVDHDWTFDHLNYTAVRQFRLNYIDEELLYRAIASFFATPNPKAVDNTKLMHLLSPLSCLDQPPQKFEEFLKFVFQSPNFAPRVMNSQVKSLPYVMKLAEILSLGGYPESLIETALSRQYIETLFQRNYLHKAFDMHQLLLVNHVVRSNPATSHSCLSDRLKDRVFEALSTQHGLNQGCFKCACDVVEDVVKADRCVVSSVQYQKELFMEKLLVIDEEGRPVPVLPEDEGVWAAARKSFCSFEELDIDPSHKKIAILNAPYQWILKPEGKYHGILKLIIRSLESEGFSVVVCTLANSTAERVAALERDLVHLGVKF